MSSSHRKKRKRDAKKASEIHTCAICFEEKETKDLALLNNCEHKYCPDCIKKWCERENSCPQCKKPITLIDIPGRKRRKRIKEKRLVSEEESIAPDHDRVINLTIMNYIASSRFRQYMAQTILRRNNMRAALLWSVIQQAIPQLSNQIETAITEDSENITPTSLDVLEARDAMLRLRYATEVDENEV